MDLFKDIWAGFSKSKTAESTDLHKLEGILSHGSTLAHSKTKSTTGRMSIFVVDNASEAKMDLRSFQPATALKDDQKTRMMDFQATSTKTNWSFLDNTRNSMLEDNTFSHRVKRQESLTSNHDSTSQMSTSQSTHVRLQRTLSSKRFDVDTPTHVIKIRDENGDLTLDFKKVLRRLAEKRLEQEMKQYETAKPMSEDVCFTLIKGAYEYVKKVRDDQLHIDGACSMIPEEYLVSAEKADFGRSQNEILHYEIERMRGTSMRLGTAQTARKEIKDTQVTNEQENMLRKLVEVGFLLNDPAVTLTIARFIEEGRAVREFRNLGLRQRSKETGRVLLNQLFSQDYADSRGAARAALAEDDKTTTISDYDI